MASALGQYVTFGLMGLLSPTETHRIIALVGASAPPEGGRSGPTQCDAGEM
jgi:hypothetical protein